jgi:hypothetical protein
MMSEWSGIGVGGSWGDVSDGRLLAENAELADRLRRMGPALANMAHELARARRENAALKRENLRLQALLARASKSREEAQVAAPRRC